MAGESGGTPTQRDKSQGPALTKDWWTKVAENVLRRTLPYGQGDGPEPELTEELGRVLLVAFGNDAHADFGETRVREFLKSSAPTDMMQEQLANDLASRSAPTVQARLRQDADETLHATGSESPSAAVSPAQASAITAGMARAGTSKQAVKQKQRPTPQPQRGKQEFFRDWIYSDLARVHQRFDEEVETRHVMFETFAGAFDGDQRKRFRDAASVVVDADHWRSAFNRALIIALGAKAGVAMDDDAYHLTAPPMNPSPSNWFIGELVHANYQFDYLAARPNNDVLAEFYVRNFNAKREPQFVNYRTLPDDDPLIGPAQYAFGKTRPDLIDFAERTVYEFKPLRGAPLGVLQLWRYTHNFNLARLFDDLVAEDRAQKERGRTRYSLRPGAFPDGILAPIELTQYVDGYMKKKRGIDKTRTWAYFAGLRARGERLFAFPVLAPAIPGLVLYSVHTNNESPEQRRDVLKNIVVTGILVAAAILLIALFAAALLGAGAGALAVGTTAAVSEGSALAGTAAVAEAGVLISGGETVMVIEEFSTAMTGVDELLTVMRASSTIL